MISSSRGWVVAGSFTVVALVAATPARPQSSGGHSGHGSHGSSKGEASDPTAAVHEAMSGAMSANPHIRLSPRRVPSADDSARADRLVAEARVALEKYKDVRVAEREGYRPFAPNVPQEVYHYTNLGAAIKEHFRLDPAEPSSLLYKADGRGAMKLVGAMYTAPKDATWNQLDARVPLGIARWHLHTNMCVPRMAQRERWLEIKDGQMVFGPASPIATREACDRVDGRFLPVVFNWMVHVNVFESQVWDNHH